VQCYPFDEIFSADREQNLISPETALRSGVGNPHDSRTNGSRELGCRLNKVSYLLSNFGGTVVNLTETNTTLQSKFFVRFSEALGLIQELG